MNRSILFAALLISGAILLNGYLDRASRPSHLARPSASVVKKAVTDGFKQDVKNIRIGDIRYSEGDRQMLIEFLVNFTDDNSASSAISLVRDDFGVYRGEWNLGGKKALFEIK